MTIPSARPARLCILLGLWACGDKEPGGGDVISETCADGSAPQVWFQDGDGDGFGAVATATAACQAPAGFIADGSDCDDSNGSVFPGATETCNEVDDDCNGKADDVSDGSASWFMDMDGDGYGSDDYELISCGSPEGYVMQAGDCDDTEATVNPEGTDVCDELDADCDGVVQPCGFAGAWTTADAAGTWLSDARNDFTGEAVAFVGDVDGDGKDDFVVGGHGWDTDPTTNSREGKAWLVYGGEADGDLSAAPSVAGGAALDMLGHQVSGVGDVDGDGLADFLVGSPGDDTAATDAGAAWLYLGSNGRWSGDYAAADVAAAVFRGVNGYDQAGYGVAGGDVDGDGFADMLITAYGADNGDDALVGAVYLVHGGKSYASEESLGDHARILGDDDHDFLGHRFGLSMGDFDADGLDEIVMGAPGHTASNLFQGGVYVMGGRESGFSGEIAVTDADTFIESPAVEDTFTYFGFATEGSSDLNSDGYADLVVGSPYQDGDCGECGGIFVFWGSSGDFTATTGDDADVRIDGAESLSYVGRDLAALGDVNGDDVPDLGIGAYTADSGNLVNSGVVYVFFGGELDGATSVDQASATLSGGATDDYLGFAVGGGVDLDGNGLADTDFDGDGTGDLLVGAPGASTYKGGAFLMSGIDPS